MKVQYKLLGQPVNPVNRSEIYLEVNHDQESIVNQPKPHVGINNLYFSREDIQKIMACLNTAPGITEGVPFDIEITERGQTEIINMYLNLMEGFKRSRNGVSCTVKMLQSLDWMDDKMDGFTMESMYKEVAKPFIIDGIAYASYKQYFDDRCIYVPYIISTIPDKQNAFMALFALVFVCIQIYRAIKDIAEAAEVWVQLIIETPFVIALVYTMLALIEQIINFLIQPLKYHGAMLLIDMLKIVSQKLGLTFQSTIWNQYPLNQIAYLPEKFSPPETAIAPWTMMTGFNIGGFTQENARAATVGGYTSPAIGVQHGYYNGTGGDFLRLVKKVCNGKIIIPDQTNDLVLERRDYYPAATPYQLPDIRQDWNGYNTEELFASMILRFASDLNEKNCMDKYQGTILQATHQQVITNNELLICLQGLREVEIGAARGVRKETLNNTEETVLDLIDVMDKWKPLILIFLNANIITANSIIIGINTLILSINGLLLVVQLLAITINIIIKAINAIPGINITLIPSIPVYFIPLINLIPLLNASAFPNSSLVGLRTGALLLENDFVNTPKLLLIDNTTTDFANQRIAYLDSRNKDVVNAQYLWDNYYFIDAFVGAVNNRFTKISPALNKDTEKNKSLLSLADFKNLVSNPKMDDNFGEEVICDSIQWYIEKNGSALFEFRKQGWLQNPQSIVGSVRATEINVNLQIQTTLPNGQ